MREPVRCKSRFRREGKDQATGRGRQECGHGFANRGKLTSSTGNLGPDKIPLHLHGRESLARLSVICIHRVVKQLSLSASPDSHRTRYPKGVLANGPAFHGRDTGDLFAHCTLPQFVLTGLAGGRSGED